MALQHSCFACGLRDRWPIHSGIQHRQPRVVSRGKATAGSNIRNEGDVVGSRSQRMAGATTQTVRAYGRRRQQVWAESWSYGYRAGGRDVGTAEAGRRPAELWMPRGVGKTQYQRGRNIPQAVHAGEPSHWNDTFATSQGAWANSIIHAAICQMSSTVTSIIKPSCRVRLGCSYSEFQTRRKPIELWQWNGNWNRLRDLASIQSVRFI